MCQRKRNTSSSGLRLGDATACYQKTAVIGGTFIVFGLARAAAIPIRTRLLPRGKESELKANLTHTSQWSDQKSFDDLDNTNRPHTTLTDC